jgi:Flp pilus assembly protein TadD
LTNILLHALNALLLAWALHRLVPARRLTGWVAALLFAVHPAASESVAYVAGRADLLLMTGALGALLLLVVYDDRRRWPALVGSYFCFALALLSKEMALIVPALLAWAMAMRPGLTDENTAWRPWHRLAWRRLAPVGGHLLLALAYVTVRWHWLAIGSDLGAARTGGIWSFGALADVATTYVSYARILLWPDALHMERLVLPDPWRAPGYLIPWLVMLGLAAALLVGRRTRRAAVFGVGWYLIGMLPVSNLWQLNAAMAEHWLYVPGVGLLWLAGLLVATIAARSIRARQVVFATLSITLLLLGLRTAVRCTDWRSSSTIFAATLEHAPMSARAHTGLGAARGREGHLAEAIHHLQQALAIDPTNADAANNLGAAYGRRGQLDSCVTYLELALALEPDNADTHNNQGNAYAMLRRPEEALARYQEALRLDPARASTYLNLGRVSRALGLTAEAQRAFRAYLRLAGEAPAARIAEVQRALAELEQLPTDRGAPPPD